MASNRTLFELNWIRTGWWLWSNNVQYSIFYWIYYWIYDIITGFNHQYSIYLNWSHGIVWRPNLSNAQTGNCLQAFSPFFQTLQGKSSCGRLATNDPKWHVQRRQWCSLKSKSFFKLVIPGILVMLAVKCNLSSNCILRSVNWDLKKPTHPDIYICRASIWKKVSCFFCRPDDVSVSCRSTAMAGAYACHDVCVAVVDNHGPHGILRCNSLSYLLLTGNYPLVPSRRGAMSMSVCSNTEAKKISRRSRPKHCS